LSQAVVLVQWSRHPIIRFGGGEEFFAVRETMTDFAGHFEVEDSPGIDWNPTTTVTLPMVVIYKPGYEPLAPGRFTERRGFRSFEELRRELKRGAVIALPKIPDEKDPMRARERGVVLDLADLGLAVSLPAERIPELIRLINLDRRRFGLEPYNQPTAGQD
jgi:hypothetical protein